MHEMKVYDGQGNLKETVTADKCLEQFWREFEEVTLQKHDETTLKAISGLLIPGQNRAGRTEMACRYCKKLYLGTLRSKFCPDKIGVEDKYQCRNMYYHSIRACTVYKDKLCVKCNKPYTPRNSSQKLCNNPCVSEHKKAKLHSYTCIVCSITFQSRMPRKMAQYCHKPCNRQIMIKKRNAKSKVGLDEKCCVSCGCSLEHLHGRRIYCGDPCNHALHEKALNLKSLQDIKAGARL